MGRSMKTLRTGVYEMSASGATLRGIAVAMGWLAWIGSLGANFRVGSAGLDDPTGLAGPTFLRWLAGYRTPKGG